MRETVLRFAGMDPCDGLRSREISRATVRQTAVETLEAPSLLGMSLQNVVEFKKKHSIYEAQVEEKNKKDGVQITETTYKNSIGLILLSTLWHAGFITSASIEAITENGSKGCIEGKYSSPYFSLLERLRNTILDTILDTDITQI